MLIDPKGSPRTFDYLYDIAKIVQSLTGHAHADDLDKFEINRDFDFHAEPLVLSSFLDFHHPSPQENQPLLDALLSSVLRSPYLPTTCTGVRVSILSWLATT